MQFRDFKYLRACSIYIPMFSFNGPLTASSIFYYPSSQPLTTLVVVVRAQNGVVSSSGIPIMIDHWARTRLYNVILYYPKARSNSNDISSVPSSFLTYPQLQSTRPRPPSQPQSTPLPTTTQIPPWPPNSQSAPSQSSPHYSTTPPTQQQSSYSVPL